MHSVKSLSKLIVGVLPAVMMLADAPVAAAAVTATRDVTGANGIVYELVDATSNTVVVSSINQSKFNGLNEDIALEIPATVEDASTNGDYAGITFTVTGMNREAFKGCTRITSVTIKAQIPEIPYNAFNGCAGLTKIEFPSSVTKIGSNAFEGCTSLTAAGNLSGVTFIDGYAFKECTSLPTIALPEGLTTLNTEAFAGCTSLTTASLPSKLKSTSSKVFENCTSLREVTIAEGVGSLGNSIFAGCTALQAPAFPSSLTGIGNSAFSGCTSLGEVTLPTGVNVGTGAFQGAKITKLTLSEGGCTLGSQSFGQVTGLAEVTVPGACGTVPADCFNACPDLTKVTLSDGVESIATSAFANCPKLTTLEMAQTVAEIGYKAFTGCSKLTGVKFPPVMTSIGEEAFYNCASLGTLTLPAGANLEANCFAGTNLTSISWPEAAMGTISKPFGMQTGITSMTLPGWMTEIPENLCKDWTGLRQIILSEGVQTVGTNAFQQSGLTSISFPSSTRTISTSAFQNCTSLADITLNEGIEEIQSSAFQGCTSLGSLTLPGTVKTLGMSSFSSCTSLESVTISAGLTHIANQTFYGCSSLKTVTLPETLESLGESAFTNCTQLNSIPLPLSLTTIGKMAFSGCSNLGEVTLHSGMTIGEKAYLTAGVTAINFPIEPCTFEPDAFSGNTKMTSITFPDWMNAIPQGFCKDWDKLTTITFGKNVKEIGDEAFYKCAQLSGVEFPTNLERIGARAFMGCTKFGDLTLSADVVIGDEAFSRAGLTSIDFDGCAEFEKDVFKDVTTIVSFTFPDCLTEIPDGFCKNWTSLKSVTLPAGLTKIGAEVFSGCRLLTTVKLPDTELEEGETIAELPTTLESIGNSAFYNTAIASFPWPEHKITIGELALGSTKITETEIPAWMDEVPAYLFSGCSLLQSLTWAERSGDGAAQSVKIGNGAFQSCSALTEINLPPVATEMGTGCFSSCSKLTTINWPAAETPITLGPNTFESCSKLTGVTLPSTIKKIPDNCFKNCYALGRFDIGSGVTEIGAAAFYGAGLSEFVWNDVVSTLGQQAFQNTTLTKIEIPGTIAEIPYQCFLNNSQLASVTFNEGLTTIGISAFQNNRVLASVTLPSTVKVLARSSFIQCAQLREVNLNEGLTSLESCAFGSCPLLTEIEFPTTLQTVGSKCFDGSGIKKVNSLAENLTLDTSSFSNCSNLETFISEGHIDRIRAFSFQNLTKLTDFTLTQEDDYVGTIENGAFFNCTSLRAVPNLSKTTLMNGAFQNCKSLVSVRLPEEGTFYTNTTVNNTHVSDYLNGATSLQSVIYPYTGPYFGIKANDLKDAPLKAVSYSYADNIVPLGEFGSTILAYDGPEVEKKSKLYVKSGQKWKYVEAGYGRRFDIEEMKDPDMTVEGDIYSDYIHKDGENYNHYTATLRWEVNLSDLDAEKPTTVEVFRDDEEEPIATVEFSAPEVSGDETLVNVTVDGETKRFEANFVAPYTNTSGETLYVMTYAVQEPTMRFDTATSKRKDAIDFYGYKSWFVLVYEFDSPDLELPSVPDRYTFSARMKGYGYDEAVNNTDCAADADGKRYTMVETTLEQRDAEPCVVPIAVAEPSLEFDGLYTTEQIMADTDHHLLQTKPWAPGDTRTYSVAYTLDPTLMNQRGYKYGTTTGAQYIYDQMIAKQVVDKNTLLDVGKTNSPSRTGEGAVDIEKQYVPQPGYRYQIITHSDYRGTFGSAVIEIPDAPEIKQSSLSVAPTVHIHEDLGAHNKATFDAMMELVPNVKAMGYDDEMPEEGTYLIGMWRQVDMYDREMTAWSTMSLADEAPAEDLVHHTSGLTHSAEAECDKCAENATGVEHDSDNKVVRYNDVFDVDVLKMYNLGYQARMYVKVPSNKLRSGDRWMIADAKQSLTGADSLTGLESLTADESGEERWYDLQGRAVPSPEVGRTYIRVTRRGAYKVVYNAK